MFTPSSTSTTAAFLMKCGVENCLMAYCLQYSFCTHGNLRNSSPPSISLCRWFAKIESDSENHKHMLNDFLLLSQFELC